MNNTYRVLYDDPYFGRTLEKFESNDKRKVNDVAKAHCGSVYIKRGCDWVYLGRYNDSYDIVDGDYVSKVEWKSA